VPKFFYTARNRSNEKITGFEEAANQEELIGRLQARDLIVVSISAETEGTSQGLKRQEKTKGRFRPRHYRITNDDLALFCRQLATLLGAGVTILYSLEIISQQVASRKLYNVIRSLQKYMESGLSMREAMAKHPYVFSELWVNLVESGEASGNLALVLSRLANYLERRAAFRRKLISALIYPAILMVASLGALLFLTIKVIPTFVDLFKGLNITLPKLTQGLVAVSSFIRKYIIIIIVVLIFGAYLFRKYIATRYGRKKYELFKLNLPIFGEFFRSLIVERFSSEMSTLVESGVPILYSLEIAEHSVGYLVMADIIRQIKEELREGKSLSQPFEKSGFFEPMVVQMIRVGEEIGELSQMFKRINAFYQEYVETFLTRFTSIFEPIMLVFMGLIIGLMVVGMFLPIFSITQFKTF
jgi:type II secretory pathway component PulF